MSDQTKPEEWLRAIVAHARDLRAAGVVRVKLEGCEVELAPAEAPVASTRRDPDDEEFADPLMDPSTYGRADGRVPGYPRRPWDDE